MTNNPGTSSSRRNQGKARANHSQFSDDNTRIANTGYMSQRSQAGAAIVAPHNNGSGALGPIPDHSDPKRQSYAYSQERRPRLFDPNGLDSGNAGQTNGPLEQSHQILPTHSIQGEAVPNFIGGPPQ
jgi:hypothetical protein